MVWLHTLTNAGSEFHIRLHDRDALGVFSAHLCVYKEVDEIVLGGLLHCLDGKSLEADIVLVIVGDELTN